MLSVKFAFLMLAMSTFGLALPIHFVTNTRIVATTVYVGEQASSTSTSKSNVNVVTVTRVVDQNGQLLPSQATGVSSSSFLIPAVTFEKPTTSSTVSSSSTSSASSTAQVVEIVITPSSSSESSTLPTTSSSSTKTVPTTSSSSSTSTAAATTTAASDDFATEILNQHNKYRALHGVDDLSWDSTLASYAQNYADEFDCGSLVHSGGPYGENLALGYSTTGAVDAWYSEGDNYDYSAASVLDHFTQVIWKDTTKLGCASKYCNSYWGTYIVCEYDPAGNVVGEANSEVLPLA
ncbi:unnamed protein product [Kuraishia capsulata CBS 1993]|uniref:SCP domain-containing protein n=1 Tax=Kuraishia capsulata CBS 1993 TaxID=1382522 RepID=W6MPV0_9ASCO|nr:uncharacterized protein KUCA_T00004665001 [Kuraishia capsulata CBS 1993]CDK28681.1 unnamed protein product [Kuraishia capsulata CBS 1993]